MTTLPALISRTRLELADQGEGFHVTAVGDGLISRIELPGRKVDAAGLMVAIDGQVLDPQTDFVIDTQRSAVELPESLDVGRHVLITGTGYRYFSEAEMTVIVETAFGQHTHGTGRTYASLPEVEVQLIAILATIEALYILLTDASYDIDISTPEGVSIPRHQRFQQLLQMIEERKAQYAQLAQALNVGIGRIEMFNLRRVSRTTGRYVPVYLDRELEDTTYPRRVFPPIDSGGGTPMPDSVPDTAITIIQGEPFALDLELGVDLTGKAVRASIRRYRRSSTYRYMKVEVTNAVEGSAVARLTGVETWSLGGGPYFWDIAVVDPVDRTPRMVAEGPVEIESRART